MKKQDIVTTALEGLGAIFIASAIANLAGSAWSMLFIGAVLVFAGWSTS